MKLCVILMFGLAALSANASVIYTAGNTPQTDEATLFHDSCSGCVDGPGTLVIGHLQTTNLLVYLTTSGQVEAVDPGHNSVTTPGHVGFSDLSISIPGYSFTSIILNLTELSTALDGTVTFVAHTVADGDISSVPLFVNHTGGNYYTITTNSGTRIIQLDFLTSQLQHDISQIRIGGAEAIPEPATFGLVGIGLAGLAILRRRRSQRDSAQT